MHLDTELDSVVEVDSVRQHIDLPWSAEVESH